MAHGDWGRGRNRVRFGQEPDGGWLLVVVMFAFCFGGATVIAIQRQSPPDDVAMVLRDVHPLLPERLAPGETLWDLAGQYAGDADKRQWIQRVCQLNGWEGVPLLPAWRTFIVPDWSERARDVTEAELRNGRW